MYFRTNTLSAKIRRLSSLDEWMVKLLRLSVQKEQSARPGAVIIQIDGLSNMEFSRAIQKKELPNIARLLKNEGYMRYEHYSGQPSSTPAVQGELFYGAKTCVPAFSFKDSKTGKIFNMFSPSNASAVENRIKHKGAALLKGGSAYGDIMTGGAKEAHFCVSAIGWGKLFSAANPAAIFVFTLMHLHIIFRGALLIVVEFFLALYDSLYGFLKGRSILHELKYVPFRVMACVVLREVTRAGAIIDITRGMPVIHLNLAGYDEQAHHRGPKSKFAHWSLRAIDYCIGKIWKAAKRSSRRDYDVFVYSDHGQEDTVSYAQKYKKPVQDAVNKVLRDEIYDGQLHSEFISNENNRHADLLRKKHVDVLRPQMQGKKNSGPPVIITALGPVGHIYPPSPLSMKQKERVALALIKKAKIPLVMVSLGARQAAAWNSQGRFMLPRDAEKILGKNHPFAAQTAGDLVELCAHEDSGEILIFGHNKRGSTLTFYSERGSHGGPGPHETAGFALLPPGIDMSKKSTIGNIEIREAVFKSLKRGKGGKFALSKIEPPSKGPVSLKVMSYNVHACRGADGRTRPDRIAQVLSLHNPDIIALQEIDTAGNVRQAKIIADMLSMNFYYHSSAELKTGLHGNAILSRFDMRLVKRGSLPNIIRTPFLEKRGILWVEIDAHGRKIQLLNTHLSLLPVEGMLQVKEILGEGWMGNASCKDPVILCGDFNSRLKSRICRAIGEKYHSVHVHATGHSHLKTFPSRFPLGLVDHIFYGGGIKAVKIDTPKTYLEKSASDHLPLIAEVIIEAVPLRNKSMKRGKPH